MKMMGRMRMDGKDNVDHEVYGSDEESPEGCAKCILPVCTRAGRNGLDDEDEDEDDDEDE